MRKKLISFAAALALSLGVSVSAFAECNYTVAQLGQQLPFPMQDARIYKQSELTPHICSIIMQVKTFNGQMQFVPLFTTSKGIIIGTLFQNKQNVTGNQIMSLQQAESAKNFNAVKDELNSIAVATYKPKNANGKILYAFVDPLCPFCHAAEPQLQGLADQSGYTIKIMPFIVHGKPAYDKMASFICSHKGNYADYIKGDYGNAKVCPQAKALLTKAQQIDSKLELSGTPTFFTSDGKMVVGANIVELKQVLGIK
ncbi:MAG: thioredoxin fold domain-containing protein [Candidatus Micrarchaeaceae archaeon]